MTSEATEKTPELVCTRWGFYQYRPLPTEEELREYYEEKYFQQGRGSYEVVYTEEEIQWFRLKSWMLRRKAEKLLSPGKKTFLDVGCGEGWLLGEFERQGHQVRGMDFSRAGIDKHHPHLCGCLWQGDIYKSLDKVVTQGEKFDIVALCNVVEHVRQPAELLDTLRNIITPESLLIIMVPNDFSALHVHLTEHGLIDRNWWLNYPDHLSYFNKESMGRLLDDLGYEIKSILADNPIDLNLLNDNSNYIMDPNKGKNAHFFRVRLDSFLGGIDRDKLLQIYEILGSMGVGRNLIFYCGLRG